ncbi:hypothetical protein [Pseudodesulfovibrio karagichevae]
MFGLFKKRKKKPSKELFSSMFSSLALLSAVQDAYNDYAKRVNEGEVVYPAHRRKGDGIVPVWHDVRTEALGTMFGFGESDIASLAKRESTCQLMLLSSFLKERPHLEFPQPRGEVVADTIQAVWQIYLYLSAVGKEVCDRETDSDQLSLSGKGILDSLEARAVLLRSEWEIFQSKLSSGASSLAEIPKTVFDVVFEDVTKKTKSIALSCFFGPNYESNIKRLKAEAGGDKEKLKAINEIVAKLMEASTPDELM